MYNPHEGTPWPASKRAYRVALDTEDARLLRINTEIGKIWVSIGNEPWRRLYELGINVLPESVVVE